MVPSWSRSAVRKAPVTISWEIWSASLTSEISWRAFANCSLVSDSSMKSQPSVYPANLLKMRMEVLRSSNGMCSVSARLTTLCADCFEPFLEAAGLPPFLTPVSLCDSTQSSEAGSGRVQFEVVIRFRSAPSFLWTMCEGTEGTVRRCFEPWRDEPTLVEERCVGDALQSSLARGTGARKPPGIVFANTRVPPVFDSGVERPPLHGELLPSLPCAGRVKCRSCCRRCDSDFLPVSPSPA
mmetsp:Transcript_46371/g.131119  ORF Transcript_46371/g.131119 Transcript_46371/m.131119 type:complete len:239 (-) Transcript_46371:289-1005(-)